jgi:hypothetical protein
MKINLVLSKSNWTSFHQDAFTNTISEYFNIVYVEDQIPNKQNSILVSNLTQDRWYQDLHQQGYKLLIDLMWGGNEFDIPDAFLLKNPNWFWYHESLLYQRKGYDQYIPNRSYSKKALMPMGIQKESYDQLFDSVSDLVDDFVYSYVGRLGKRLPNDAPDNFWTNSPSQLTGFNQRYFNPEWYNQTYYSLVAETTVCNLFPLHPTEKTFKPIAFRHPYIVWGQQGILNHLHNIGFETYENLFEESYDLDPDRSSRLHKVVNNVRSFKYDVFDDLTNQKTKHNHQLFFNLDLIRARIKKEIVEPILDFFEKR